MEHLQLMHVMHIIRYEHAPTANSTTVYHVGLCNHAECHTAWEPQLQVYIWACLLVMQTGGSDQSELITDTRSMDLQMP